MKKNKVLLVEDNDEISSIVSWLLEEEGYAVNSTTHLPAKQLAAFEPDLIVLDEWLADIGGHMLCKEIKAMAELAHVPVIIFSTATDIEELMASCGADGFVRKPFDLQELTREVGRLLNPHKISASYN
ncbi:response regulator transcription factor [Mucilaginibacter terrae]|uniref:Two-component system OmpR family response regulator n=1 Tax=Mucilaginibacter terrae TaxID=1955052 RepID=A0ABU3H0C8_9SPHI|nr:response regulator [Mucilaginibacter terrae]MDT3405370.1 two-component system OmpR family response regulator [Mucilaginibacter terrae]